MTLTYPNFKFDITYKDPKSRARLGKLTTPHGTIDTPNYIFCGTKAAIKNLSPAQMREAKTDIILSNTYHLMLQPGADLVEKMGGLHKFMRWDGPMLTDSGGFQVFSMKHGGVADEIKGKNRPKRESTMLKITEEGVKFRSYVDGSYHFLTPESSMDIQRKLGADLIMQFDECTATHDNKEYTAASMRRSCRWGDRCLTEFERTDTGAQALYGIIQGGVFKELREESRDYISNQPFFGTAVGGAFGGVQSEYEEILGWSMDFKNEAINRPVHLLGIGTFSDVFIGVRHGIDTFDCVIPTRLARHATAFMKGAKNEKICLTNAQYRDDPTPLDPESDLPAAQFSKSYIHHLFKANELLGIQILAQYNVSVMNRMMREIRAALKEGTLDALEKEWVVRA